MKAKTIFLYIAGTCIAFVLGVLVAATIIAVIGFVIGG